MTWTEGARPSWDVDLPIIGEDGNVFNLIGKAQKVLRRYLIDEEEKTPAEAREVTEMLFKYLTSQSSYDSVLAALSGMFNVTYVPWMQREIDLMS